MQSIRSEMRASKLGATLAEECSAQHRSPHPALRATFSRIAGEGVRPLRSPSVAHIATTAALVYKPLLYRRPASEGALKQAS
jgi:hypothetical protein